MSKHVAIIVGSLRRDSLSRKVAQHLIETAPKGLSLKIVEIGDLAHYNEDLDSTPPQAWSDFRQTLKASDALLFITPEFNRSVPGALKNAIDVGSRPYGASAWAGKPAAIVTISQGALGGFGANHHLRQSLVFLDVPTLQQPEAYLSAIQNAFDAHGKLTNENVRGYLANFMAHFKRWVLTHGAAPALALAS